MKRKKTKPKSKSIYKKISKKYYIPALLLLLAGIFYFTPARGMVAQKLLVKGNSYFNSAGVYDLDKAAKWYKAAVFMDHKSSAAHYQLARVYFVQNKLPEAKFEIDQTIKINPEGERSYYIKGLIDGYSKNYQEAIIDFSKFIERHPGGWAGYNDLAWVYYENKDYESAKKTLEKGLEAEPDNPWLLNGLGASLLALKEYSSAEEALNKAGQTADKLTVSEWKMAYPGNDPFSADWDLADFKTNIKFNQGLAYDKSSKEAIMAPACGESCTYACLDYVSNLYRLCPEINHMTGTDLAVWENIGPDSSCSWCGNGQCAFGEDCNSCSADCGGCAPSLYCGDGMCTGPENCGNCSADCGGCACTDSSWTPNSDPATKCIGTTEHQTSNCGTGRDVPGTKNCVGCVDSSWTPDSNPATKCIGTTEHQTSNCGTGRDVPGTKVCVGNNAPTVSIVGPKASGLLPGALIFEWDYNDADGDAQSRYVIDNISCNVSGSHSSIDDNNGNNSKTIGGFVSGDNCSWRITVYDSKGVASPPDTASFSIQAAPAITHCTCGSANGGKMCNDTWPGDSTLCSVGSVGNKIPGAVYGDWTWSCVPDGICNSTVSCSAKGKGSCGWIETAP